METIGSTPKNQCQQVQDKFVEIYADHLCIKSYYFPLGRETRSPWSTFLPFHVCGFHGTVGSLKP